MDCLQTARYNWAGPLTSWSQRIPFYLPLRRYAKRSLPAWRALPFVMQELQALEGSEPEQWVVEHLAASRGLILLDGLDEVPEEKRIEALTWLEMILSQYPETLVIVSTRPSGLVGEQVKPQLQKLAFEAVRLEHLRSEQVTDFVQQWHLAMRHDQCEFPNKSIVAEREERLLDILRRRKDIAGLTTTPLLCAMICALHLFELRDLPHDRIRLYERCINILLNRDENREIDPGNVPVRPRPETMRRLLAHIGYWMMKNEPAIIRQGDALRLLRSEENNAESALVYLAARSVLFRQQAVDEYDFIHRTFLEFLAAEQIVRQHEAALVVKTHGISSEWHETIRLLAGHAEASDKADVLAELYQLAHQHPAEKRTLHLLAWDFWALLDVRPNDAAEWMYRHVDSLNLGGAAGLYLSSTQVSDVSALAGLTNLQQLDLSYTQVSDVSALAGLTNLQQLDLSYTQVSDVSALAGLTNLQQLDLINTQVSDITPLHELTTLKIMS
ncbi:MAG: leucine-rich repeat domain-containing protein [Caldilineaceae bacterium]